ncbi:MAG: RNA 2',3'-cyclic phosphodiesterase [Candidatus Nezhaarchaeota archaeon]|nr:RNA 2',3'-cyclic phosphodiesterase [Candidatus Nezhaarchaeota archaeon]MCX8142077.1 RNA 2',3'-cyclic phosphodiesterase [Candidatus Nezhaarchaeota archaeon]MDW8050142.1 RNA 2',3'-cyclic phosphodiesterase [Nitrososphaerota archaeon]
MSSSLIRCFIAIDVDDPKVVSKIMEIQRELQTGGSKLKLVEPENLHLTLFFLGEQPPKIVEKVQEAMSTISFKPFVIKIQGLGAFPSPDRPRVIWVGVVEGFDEVKRIYAELRPKLKAVPLRLEPESSFVPHITIARVKFSGYALRKAITSLKDIEFGFQEVKAIKLKRSTLTPRGPIYDTIYEARG